MNKFFTYFFRGLLFTVPLAVTVYVVVAIIKWIDGLIPNFWFPGSGFLVLVIGITGMGYIGSQLIFKRFFSRIEKLINRLPFVSIVYASLKDLLSAFVGDKKKFNQPVLVLLNRSASVYKLGFITQNDLHEFPLQKNIAVYLPHSYNFSGDLFIVPPENITPIEASGTDVMRFVVSGGLTKL